MTGPVGSNELEKEILRLLEDLPLEVGIPENVRQLLLQAGRPLAMKVAHDFLASADDKKKSAGAKIAMFVDAEENVELILPLLDETNTLLRWQAVDFIARSRKFLEGGGVFVDCIIKALLEDSSPEVRTEAADALGYCKATPNVILALEYARDHDFEFDRDGYRASTIAKESIKRIQERQNDL